MAVAELEGLRVGYDAIGEGPAVHVFAGVGHLPFVERPAELGALVLDALRAAA